MACGPCAQSGRPCDGTCGHRAALNVSLAPTSFARFGGTLRPAHTVVTRPAGDAAPEPEATRTTTADPPREDAGLQVGRQVISTTTDAIAREQERARQEQEQRARERLAEIEAQRDIELARIRANAQASLAQREASTNTSLANPPRTEFTVLGLEAAQNVNARPASTAQNADGGVLAWVKENPIPTAIGAAVVLGGIVYFVKSSKKRRSR
ncbi:MAG: hypothetical protein U0269_38575 [Polyangiales bacterium]